MTSQTNLEIKGLLRTNPLADLLAETSQSSLNGSFRLGHETQKTIVYLIHGKPVFAASNARQHRLFEMLLQNKKIAQQTLVEIPNFTNDLELSEDLMTRRLFSKDEIESFFSIQIEEILKNAFGWTAGEWVFSPLMRIKETIRFKVKSEKLLLEYARNLPASLLNSKFNNPGESFGANPAAAAANLELLPHEAFVLSRFERSFLKIDEIKNLSGLPDDATLRILYSLWLGGFLFRQNWTPAFSARKIDEINSAKLTVKKEPTKEEEKVATISVKPPIAKTFEGNAAALTDNVSPQIPGLQNNTLESYLNRVENAESYYELFDLAVDADSAEIKRAYFAIAKQFHPDKFHQEKDPQLIQRIQDAFTEAAQGYEILKSEDTRKNYDYKLSKHLTKLKTRKAATTPEAAKSNQAEMAKESFEQGFSLLMEDEFEEALPLLARAVQYAPENARYHAFYGKALSSDETQRFKADAEMQTAVRLDPQNATFRIILAEFYIQFGLFRRAEGELQRLLAAHPNHPEGIALLDSLPKK